MSESENLLGFTYDSDITLLSISFVIIIFYLVIAEYGLSVVDKSCRETAYAQAIQSLYKELVIMGISSFILSVLVLTEIIHSSAWVFYMVNKIVQRLLRMYCLLENYNVHVIVL